MLLCLMEKQTIKPGPKKKYVFAEMPIGTEVVLEPLKQSSFKSMLSNFNKDLQKPERHQYRYEQFKRVIVATRIA